VGVKNVADKVEEISNQIKITRNILGNNSGVIHYSVDGISKNYAMQTALQNLYKEKALVPASPWIKSEPVLKPEITAKKSGNNAEIHWFSRNPQQAKHFILFAKYGNKWETEILNGDEHTKFLPLVKSGVHLTDLALKAVDRLGNVSDYVAVEIH
jgi:hypothetical protein